MAPVPAPERGSFEWRERDRVLRRYVEVRGAEDGTPEAREARRLEDRLLRSYEALVGRALGARRKRVPMNLDALVRSDDLRTVGLLGLLRALRTWKPERGRRFADYALQMVRWEMIHELRGLDALGIWMRRRVKAAIRAAEAVEARTGRCATDEEAASEAGITVERYRELVALDERGRYSYPLPDYDGPGTPADGGDEPDGFDLGTVEVQGLARWLMRFAGEGCAREIAGLYAAKEWGDVGPAEAWRNDRAAKRGAGLVSGLYELHEAGGARVLVVTDFDAGTTSVVVDEMPGWVASLAEETERGRAA
ncbi:MAG: hypothetical protein M3R38_23690 [Actinomycetota bacterium]|nr:hypothetical protein [Actinomycetota bacterium]